METPGTGTGGPALVTGETVLIILTVSVLIRISNKETPGTITGGPAQADRRDSSDNAVNWCANYNIKQGDTRNRNSRSNTGRQERQF